MKLLYVGSCSSYFLVPLAKALKNADPNIYIGVLDLANPSGELHAEEKAVFDEILITPKGSISGGKFERFKNAIKYIAKAKGLKNIISDLFRGKFKQTLTEAESALVQNQIKASLAAQFSRYDVVQLHYLKALNVKLAELIPAAKLMMSFWGSDLLQDEEEVSRGLKLEMLQKAKVITVQTQDLRQIIAIKYGRKYYEKVRCNLFLPNQTIFDQIKKGNRKKGIEWLQKYGAVDEESVTVLLGYNSRPILRIQETLNFLLSEKADELAGLHFVFTFSYGKNEQTEREIVELLQSKNVPFTVVNGYLNDDEMALFRLSVDVLFHIPHTDAFSTTMIEHFYAGARVITGTWLPYGKLRRAGVAWKEIENYQQIPFDFFSNQRLMNNPPLLDQMYEEEQSTQKWLEIYRSV